MFDDKDLREIFANAPKEKEQFEVLELNATWFSKKYYLQTAINSDIEIELEDKTKVIAHYCPMELTNSELKEDLSYERSITFQFVNDLIASESSRFNPELVGEDRLPKIRTRIYIHYSNGTYKLSAIPPITVNLRTLVRNEDATIATASTKSTDTQTTGDVITVEKFPSLKAFL